jgi:hypothetical protein
MVATCVASESTPQPDPGKSDDSSGQCVEYADAVQTGKVRDGDAQELSGLVASRTRPGILWAHNDGNGNSLKLYAIDRNAQMQREVRIRDLELEDLEDIAIGPGPIAGQDYLYLADTGDNGNERSEIQVIRIPEPDLDSDADILREEADVYRFRYDDHDPHDAEALMVDPDTGDIYVITKHGPDERRTRVYKGEAPLDPVGRNTLVEVLRDEDASELRGSVVAADISPGGEQIALLFKEEATRIWTRAPGQSIADTLRGDACHAPSAPGQQESFAWSTQSGGFYLVPEGSNPAMSFVAPLEECPDVSSAGEVGPVEVESIEEVSGLVVSSRDPDLLWAINDSGKGETRNHISAIARDGSHLGDIQLPSIENEDWEDLAMGPGPQAGLSYLYIADIGDNDRERGKVEVHRVLEPLPGESPGEVESFSFEYPNDDPHDAESILVDGITGDLFIITRQRPGDSKTKVYRAQAPLDPVGKTTLEKVMDADDSDELNHTIVGADISADGLVIALARRDGVPLLYHRRPEAPAFEAWKYSGCRLPSFAGKHDAIALEAGGEGYFQLAEGIDPSLFQAVLSFLPGSLDD